MSTFTADLRQEQLLQPFLDRCYRKYGITSERCVDEARQRDGVDVLLSRGALTLRVDEKAQLHYIGESLPTFALEVDFLKNGLPTQGWLFDATKVTEVYAFVFDIRLHANETKLMRWTQVKSAHIILVNRQRLIGALDEAGLNQSILDRFSSELRSSTDQRRTVRAPGSTVIISRQLEEQPVNLLVKRSFLLSMGQSIVW